MGDERKSNKPMLKKISAKNVLSFGPDGMELELRPLNVLIGANGSGKSNLFELLNLLRAAPTDLSAPVRESGGVSEWIWRGQPDAKATVEAVAENPAGGHPIRHAISFRESGRMFSLTDERIEYADRSAEHERAPFFYKYRDGRAALNLGSGVGKKALGNASTDKSVLSERKDPAKYPEFDRLSEFYSGIGTYRYWDFGQSANVRRPQRKDAAPSPLREDLSNLGMFLNRLELYPASKRKLVERLKDLYREFMDYSLRFDTDTVQIRFNEGDFSIPSSRLSDGGLRYLALLAILLDPEPPPLIAIEEPDLGLHFDLISNLSKLLVDASSRTQLIITTRSDILVDALSRYPESLVICEKRKGQSSMRRLDQERLSYWLERYMLGQLWSKGNLGGVRW